MAEPRFSPAECSADHCNDRDCPYSHYDAWEVKGEYYLTLEDALASVTAVPVSSTPVASDQRGTGGHD